MNKNRITTMGRTQETLRLLTSVTYDEEFSLLQARTALGGEKRGITDHLVRFTLKELEIIGAIQATKQIHNGKVIMRYRLTGEIARRMVSDACVHAMIASKTRITRMKRA